MQGKFIDRTGERFLTNEGYWIEIVKFFGALDCTIKFDIGGHTMTGMQIANLKRGVVRNVFHRSVFGMGYLGEGKYRTKVNGETTKSYSTWQSMIQRCYSEKSLKKRPSYIGCSVDERWHNYQVFAKWYEENQIEDCDLDKDIIVKWNKIYSPETCVFVPHEINTSLTKRDKKTDLPIGIVKKKNRFQARLNKGDMRIYLGLFRTIEEAFQVYKIAKESYIKELAEKWKSVITPECYNALMNYKVEITD